LLRTFVESQPLTLYVEQMQSPRQFLLAMLHALHSADAGNAKFPTRLSALSYIFIERHRAPALEMHDLF
jgi:hypothetical protein